MKISKKRKDNKDYSSFAFTFIAEWDETQKLQCFLYDKVFANASMKPEKLKEELNLFILQMCQIVLIYFVRERLNLRNLKLYQILDFPPTQKPCLKASYKVIYCIAKQKKLHTLGKTLVKPCALEMVELVCDLE